MNPRWGLLTCKSKQLDSPKWGGWFRPIPWATQSSARWHMSSWWRGTWRLSFLKVNKFLQRAQKLDTKRQSTHVPLRTRSNACAFPSLHNSNSSAAISASRGFKAQLYRKHPSLLDFLYSDFTRFYSNKNISESVIVL